MNTKIKKLYILYFILLTILFTIFFKYSYLLQGHKLCLFKRVTNIPCVGCGTTRAAIEIFKGNIKASLYLNPLALIVISSILISLIIITFDIIKSRSTLKDLLVKKMNRRLEYIIWFLLIVNWIWNIQKGN